jgi:hypothetical protein
MIIDNIMTAKHEAKRFVRLVMDLEADIKSGEYGEPKRWNIVGGTKQTAAIRRASMDLTRALTELRRPT